MRQIIDLWVLISLISLTSCNSFEKRFYKTIDQGQIIAIRNGADTFDLSIIADFEWDSMMFIQGNESVPIFKEQIEEILNNHISDIDWEDRRLNQIEDPKLVFKTKDLPINRDRFYFLTSEKKMIEKEIKSGIEKHRPAFSINDCFTDSTNLRYWLSKKECRFILRSNVPKAGQGTVFLQPGCFTKK